MRSPLGPVRARTRRARPRFLLAVLCGLLLCPALTAAASGDGGSPPQRAAERGAQPRALSFPVHEPFDGAAGNLGSLTGTASYVSDGWLRLTSAAGNQAGGWQMNDSFSTGLGIVAEFTYASYGGTAFDGRRGDGIAFFLSDGGAANGTGAPGGALGYACSGNPCTRAGVPGAFLGIGIDEFGNFSSGLVGNGGPGSQANRIVLRGGGNGNTGYRFGTSVMGPGNTVETTGRGDYRTVRVSLVPRSGRLLVSVWSDTGPGTALNRIITDSDVSAIANQPALPSTLKVGFSAGTGGATNIHEIGDLKINVPADLSVTKTADRTTVPAGGGPVTYTVRVANSDANDVTGAQIRDTVPGLTGVTWTCAATTGSACGQASGSGNTLATTADLLRGGSATYTITGTAPAQPATLVNTVTVTPPGNRSDTDASNNSASVTTTVTALADVSAAKSGVGTGPVTPGQEFDYRVTATNSGPSDTSDVAMTDTLPAGLTFVSSTDGCTASGLTVTCPARATLPAGQSSSWVFRVRLDPAYTGDGSALRNTATLTHAVSDPNPANNTSAAALPPGGVTAPRADLRTVKRAVGATPVAPGRTFDYEVTVTNGGPSVARQVTLTDPLPDALSFDSSTGACTAAGRNVTCGPVAALAPGASVTWTFRVLLDPGYDGDGTGLLNTATVSSATDDPDPSNNSGSAGPPGGRTARPTADLVLTKQAS
ncbi:hypothetical protein [Streptomyces uncialis]|uniref:hypothetical protein n=1 Tax=Streptomyces uncialis TaxID=1048205 RepID=UPI00225932A0|nr:hypothetical protein [Streptomyces uncialis]MCX4658977.1 hypothetical protein [Streptomyces uncialis]